MWAVRALIMTGLFCVTIGQTPDLPLEQVQLPAGFSISLYTQQPVLGARQMSLSRGINVAQPNAVIVYVGSTGATVNALVDPDGTGENVTVVPMLKGLDGPNGVTWHAGSLYVAEIRRITRYDNADTYALAGQPFPPGIVIAENWNPDQQGHPYHYINVGPDSLLYVPQGSPSNTGPCEVYQNITQCAMNRMNLDGTGQMTLATGIRNTVGYDWDSEGNLWVSSNGRDNLDPDHDNRPDDPLLFIPAGTAPETLNFGFPYCHWQGEGDPLQRALGPGIINIDDVNVPVGVDNNDEFNTFCSDPANNQPPSQSLGPHVAALGLRFYQGTQFPPEYNGSIFIAQHGSWNRDQAIGYRVMHATVEPNGTTTSYSVFASGWLQNPAAKPWGRPVDVLPLPDGSLLVSDDGAGVVYRIVYGPSATPATSSAG